MKLKQKINIFINVKFCSDEKAFCSSCYGKIYSEKCIKCFEVLQPEDLVQKFSIGGSDLKIKIKSPSKIFNINYLKKISSLILKSKLTILK